MSQRVSRISNLLRTRVEIDQLQSSQALLAKGAQALGWPFSPESTAATAIPLVALSVWWSLRRLHRQLHRALPVVSWHDSVPETTFEKPEHP